jgi:tetratricopeptide (TPR) repeat protein
MLIAFAALAGCGGAEERMARAIERGEAFLAEENFDKARIEFSNALQIDPNNAQVIYLAGAAAEGLREYRAAAQAYQAALNVDASHVDAAAALGRLYLFSGLPERALEQLAPAFAVAPSDPDLLTVRAAANAALGHLTDALHDAERVVAEHPEHEQAVALLAGLYRNRGESERAIGLVDAALARVPDSTELRTILSQLYQSSGKLELAELELKRIIDLAPDEITHRNRLVQFYISTNRSSDAEAVLRENVARAPDVLDYKILLVNFIRAQKSFDEAEQEMQRLVAAAPEDPDLKLALGELYEVGEDRDSAEQVYREVAAAFGVARSGLLARGRLAALMLASNRIDEGERLLNEVLTENPRDNSALMLRASVAIEKGELLAAITDLRSVIRDQPEAANALAMLARAHARNNEPDLAIESFRRAVTADAANNALRIEFARYLQQHSSAQEAEQLLAAAINAKTADLATLELMFQLRLGAGKVDAAAQTAEQAIAAQPENALGYYLRGQAYEAAGSLQEAHEHYAMSLERSPRGAEPLSAIVRLEAATGRLAAAKDRLTQTTAQFPDHAVARSLLAEVQVAERDPDSALANLSAAISTSPGWWVPYRTKATILKAKGDLGAALAVYEQGMHATRDAPVLGIEYAALLEQLGEAERAIEVYESLYSANPTSEVIANNYAMMLSTYRSDKASLDRAYELVRGFRNTQVPAYLDTYGWVRFKQGNLDEAITYLRRAVAAAPSNAAIRYHLGKALLENGEIAGARAELAAAIDGQQSFTELDEARDLLARID